MTLDLVSIKFFISVAEAESFTKAAKMASCSQSAVSQQIAKLEKQIGQKLFFREKNLILTPSGKIFLGYAKKIFNLHCEAMDRMHEPDLEGEVSFGLPEDFASLFLSDVLAHFSHIHPRILLNVECDLTVNLFNRFKKGEFDLVLLKRHHPNSTNVWTEPLRWVGDETLIESNKPVPLILSPLPCVYRTAAINSLETVSRSWRLVFVSTSYASTAAAVKAGMGITVMPITMIPKNLKALNPSLLPKLPEAHTCLLKHDDKNSALNSLETFVFETLGNVVKRV